MGLETIILGIVVPIIIEILKKVIPSLKEIPSVAIPAVAVGVGVGANEAATAMNLIQAEPSGSIIMNGATIGLLGIGTRELAVKTGRSIVKALRPWIIMETKPRRKR